jgi:steroid 5-alpha reductase family enzyme
VIPTEVVLYIAGGACAYAWIASLLTGDTSWVDRLWSILPVAYVWVFAGFAGLANARLDVMAALTTLWGIRLTFNFARKGGYSGVEDYRWAVLRARMRPWQFQLFNLFFIVLYQNALLVLIALPALSVYQHPTTSFGAFDVALVLLFLACLLGETIADEQQWRFHSWKHAEVAAGRSPGPGFLQDGLFRFSRHPNYFFEIAQWWLVFLFAAVGAGSLLQWTVIGAFLLTLLFVGSTRFTETISSARYPGYAQYQSSTSPVIPWLKRAPIGAVVDSQETGP